MFSLIVSIIPKDPDFAMPIAIEAYSGAKIIGNKVAQMAIIRLKNA